MTSPTAFNQFLKDLGGEPNPTLLDMHKAFGIIATIYVENSLNLVSEATLPDSDKVQILEQADVMFKAWEQELGSLKTAIQIWQSRAGQPSTPGRRKKP